MKLVEWQPEFSVEEPTLDSQHRLLVAIINQLEEAIRKGKGRRRMNDILGELIDYTREHFACEEKHMQAAGYEGYEAHCRRHRRLIQKIERFRREHGVEGKRVSVEMREFLRTWLTDHILKEDKAYVDALKQFSLIL